MTSFLISNQNALVHTVNTILSATLVPRSRQITQEHNHFTLFTKLTFSKNISKQLSLPSCKKDQKLELKVREQPLHQTAGTYLSDYILHIM